jgi:predicted DCC family thiol-disulfide oxidoreductase YuxK
MSATKQISPWQFTGFRIVFGVYLAIHFAHLVPHANELFGSAGVLADARANPLHGLFPNPLAWFSWPQLPTVFVFVLVVLSINFTVGLFRRTCALVLWFGWACLFNRNNLIANPGIPYVGLLLVLCALVPKGEPLTLRKQKTVARRCMPAAIYWGAWALLAIGYTYSGIWKLFSPSWIDGTALAHLMNNPLARPGIVREFLQQFPSALSFLTWTALAGELLFLPLALSRRGRLVAWLWMTAMHLGILLVVDFADLTFGMLMVHLFTLDPEWVPAERGRAVVLFDGECGMCNRWVQFILREESEATFEFAPLQSEAGRSLLRSNGFDENYRESILVVEVDTDGRKVLMKSAAILRILTGLGGFWRVLSAFALIPRPVQDWLYDQVARRRHLLFGTPEVAGVCILTARHQRRGSTGSLSSASTPNTHS